MNGWLRPRVMMAPATLALGMTSIARAATGNKSGASNPGPGGQARTFDFHAGDMRYVPRGMGHYVENTGGDLIRYLELFNYSYYTDVSLTSWMAHTPHDVVAQHLKIDPSVLDRLPMQKQPVVPA